MLIFNCRCYYGLSFASTSLSGDAFTNFLLRCHLYYVYLISRPSVFIEIPSAICCILVIDCWGRRPTLSFCQVTNSSPDPSRSFLALPASSVACYKESRILDFRPCR